MAGAPSRRAYRAQQEQLSRRQSQRDSSHSPSASRAGRDLRAAIGVGVGLGVVIVAALLLWKPAFVAIATLAACLGAWELLVALRAGRIVPPTVPTMMGALALVPVAYLAGPEGLVVGYGLCVLAVLLWRALDGLPGAITDIAGGVLVLSYVPLLAALTSLMLVPADGPQRVLVFLITTVASDVGGYAVGVLTGRHPMAPSISPKKSWEGLAGSVAACAVAGTLSVVLLLEGRWWAGALLGLAVALAATVGDLAESTLKRDLGIKDMGSLLPGHGGVMDRLDSLLVAVPVSWALLSWLVPA